MMQEGSTWARPLAVYPEMAKAAGTRDFQLQRTEKRSVRCLGDLNPKLASDMDTIKLVLMIGSWDHLTVHVTVFQQLRGRVLSPRLLAFG
jgi:hypothetical protein